MKKLPTILFTLLCLLPLAGCVSVTDASRPQPTVGQQLLDLQKARDAGAITPEQYEAKKAELLKK